MEEKILIKSEQYDVKKVFKAMVIIGIVLAVIGSILAFSNAIGYYNRNYGFDHEHERYCYKYEYWDDFYSDEWEGNLQTYKMDCYQVKYGNAFVYALSRYFSEDLWISLIPIASLALIGGLIYLWLRSYELTVTDKRIFGKVAWGKRVDLPVDSVSATATIRGLKGVSVSTSSGRISFLVIKNADEIYKIMNDLLIERQQERANATVVAANPKTDEADQLKKYKDLLDSGVITQEEFEAKKKQLLGL